MITQSDVDIRLNTICDKFGVDPNPDIRARWAMLKTKFGDFGIANSRGGASVQETNLRTHYIQLLDFFKLLKDVVAAENHADLNIGGDDLDKIRRYLLFNFPFTSSAHLGTDAALKIPEYWISKYIAYLAGDYLDKLSKNPPNQPTFQDVENILASIATVNRENLIWLRSCARRLGEYFHFSIYYQKLSAQEQQIVDSVLPPQTDDETEKNALQVRIDKLISFLPIIATKTQQIIQRPVQSKTPAPTRRKIFEQIVYPYREDKFVAIIYSYPKSSLRKFLEASSDIISQTALINILAYGFNFVAGYFSAANPIHARWTGMPPEPTEEFKLEFRQMACREGNSTRSCEIAGLQVDRTGPELKAYDIILTLLDLLEKTSLGVSIAAAIAIPTPILITIVQLIRAGFISKREKDVSFNDAFKNIMDIGLGYLTLNQFLNLMGNILSILAIKYNWFIEKLVQEANSFVAEDMEVRFISTGNCTFHNITLTKSSADSRGCRLSILAYLAASVPGWVVSQRAAMSIIPAGFIFLLQKLLQLLNERPKHADSHFFLKAVKHAIACGENRPERLLQIGISSIKGRPEVSYYIEIVNILNRNERMHELTTRTGCVILDAAVPIQVGNQPLVLNEASMEREPLVPPRTDGQSSSLEIGSLTRHLDTHWYNDEEIKQVLEHYFSSPDCTVDILAPLHLNSPAVSGIFGDLPIFRDVINAYVSRRGGLGQPPHLNQVLLPINVDGNHWTLLYIKYDDGAQPRIVKYFNPLGRPKEAAALQIHNFFISALRQILRQAFHYDELDIEDISDPIQTDDYNCGPWIVEAARTLVASETLPQSNLDIQKVRGDHAQIYRPVASIPQQAKPSVSVTASPTSAKPAVSEPGSMDEISAREDALRLAAGSVSRLQSGMVAPSRFGSTTILRWSVPTSESIVQMPPAAMPPQVAKPTTPESSHLTSTPLPSPPAPMEQAIGPLSSSAAIPPPPDLVSFPPMLAVKPVATLASSLGDFFKQKTQRRESIVMDPPRQAPTSPVLERESSFPSVPEQAMTESTSSFGSTATTVIFTPASAAKEQGRRSSSPGKPSLSGAPDEASSSSFPPPPPA